MALEKVLRGDRARIEELTARLEARVRRAFRRFLDEVRSPAVRRQVRIALERRSVAAALRVIDAHVARMGTVISQVFQAAAGSEAEALARQLGAGAAHIAVTFDPTWPRAAALMRQNTLRFVREFTAVQRTSTRAALQEAFNSGAGAVQTARAFRDSIGLTAYQRQVVANYRRALEMGDAAALTRDLRDRRFDRTVRRAIETGEPLGPRQINRMVERYRSIYLQYRAENIARTETLQVANAARDEGLRQVLDQVQLAPSAVRQTWRATRDVRTRDTHAAMDGQVQPMGTPFESPSGARLLYPGDRSLGASAAEIINCLLPWALVDAPGLTAVARAWYEGEAVFVELASGRTLPVTANHPVMTDGGWRPATKLQKGCKLLYNGGGDVGVVSCIHAENVPPTIENLYESPALVPIIRKRLSMNFHGDITDGDVEIKVPARNLLVVGNVCEAEPALEPNFYRAGVRPTRMARERPRSFSLFGVLTPTPSGVCSSNLSSTLFLRHTLPLDCLGFRLGAWPHAKSFESTIDCRAAYAVEFAKIAGAHPGLVQFDEVVRVRRHKWVGHVYSPQTESGLYLANNILSHNCRCVLLTTVDVAGPEL